MLGVKAGVNHADNHTFTRVGRRERGSSGMYFVKAERLTAEIDSERACPFGHVEFAVEAHAQHAFGGSHCLSLSGVDNSNNNVAVGVLHVGAGGTQPRNGGVVGHFHEDGDLRCAFGRRRLCALRFGAGLQFQLVKMAECGLRGSP